uniref:B-cell receptor CD22 n=1 Tax=Anabas testudineus TaxID=64144 RepID=A0A3Q1GYQ6_ANATE
VLYLYIYLHLVQGQNDWGVTYTSTQICGIKGSTVDIHCYYTYPSKVNKQVINVQKTLWFTKGNNNEPVDLRTDSDYIGRVTYQCVDKACTLKITDLRQRDSAVYKFRFITNHPDGKYTVEPGVTLSVTDRPNLPSVSVSPSEIVEGSSVTLTCSSDANPAANYTWYKSDTHLKSIHEEPQFVFRSIKSSDSGQYYCEAGNKLGTSSSKCFMKPMIHYQIFTNRPNLPSVSVSPSEIVEGSSVTLTCSSDANPAANYTWYKENEESPKASGQIFTITDIRAEHSGNYYCEVQNSVGRHNNTLHLTVAREIFHSENTSFVCFFFFYNNRSSTGSSEPEEKPDNREQVRTSLLLKLYCCSSSVQFRQQNHSS